MVKSISSLLSESLNRSIGHFKYIQEIVEDNNKVNLTSLEYHNQNNLTTPKVATIFYPTINETIKSNYSQNNSSSTSLFTSGE